MIKFGNLRLTPSGLTPSGLTPSSLTPSGLIIAAWSLVILAITFVVLADLSIYDHYMFRQTQVATVAREIMNGGPWVDYLMPVLGPPWTAPMEFPVYQIVIAGFANATGLELEFSGRLISLISGLAGLLFAARAMFLAGFSVRESGFAMFFMAASPIYLYWSHTVMIETMAFALSMAMLVMAMEFTERGRLWPLGLGAVFAVLAALAKATTFGMFAVVIFALFAVRFLKFAWDHRTDVGAVAERGLQWLSYGLGLLGPALLVSAVWVDHADAIKSGSPLSTFLTSESLAGWNFGALGEGVKAFSYMFARFRDQAPPLFEQALGWFWLALLLLAVVGIVARGRHRPVTLGLLFVGFAAGPAVFRNLYETHYYYWVANMPFLLAIIGLGMAWGVDFLDKLARSKLSNTPKWTGNALIALPVAMSLIGGAYTYRTFFLERTLNGQANSPRSAGVLVREITTPEDVVMTYGVGWTPIWQYGAERRMIMIRNADPDLSYLAEQQVEISALMVCGSARDHEAEFLAAPYFGAFADPELHGEAGPCRVYQIRPAAG